MHIGVKQSKFCHYLFYQAGRYIAHLNFCCGHMQGRLSPLTPWSKFLPSPSFPFLLPFLPLPFPFPLPFPLLSVSLPLEVGPPYCG